MIRIAPVRLMYNPKTLWFDAGDLDIAKDQHVVVTTARGTEYGTLAEAVFEIEDDEAKKLKSPLKPVKRVATPDDDAQAEKMHALSLEAMPVFREMAAEDNETMRPISVEYLFDGDKAIFYFEAEERVDFRDLVRKLASHFRVRVDMRQIGVRDEARMIGGLGHCGQELCCKRLGGEFNPVTIKMAKEQDLSLNPTKISGICGRLMCCLRYEYEAYKDFHSRAPKQNATIQTPDGPARISSMDALREVLTLRLEDGKEVKVPLADFEPAEEGSRPNTVGEAAWEKATEPVTTGWAATTLLRTDQFTEADKLGTPTAVRRTGSASKQRPADAQAASGEEAKASTRKRRRRRSAGGSQGAQGADAAAKAAGDAAGQTAEAKDGQRPRPGQKSSELRRQQAARREGAATAGDAAKPSRTRRRRSSGNKDAQAPSAAAQGTAPQAGASQAQAAKQQQGEAKQASRRRRSRGGQAKAVSGSDAPKAAAGEQSQSQQSKPAQSQSGRSPRRRKSVNIQTGKQDGNEAQ